MDRDLGSVRREDCKVMTKRAPTEKEWKDLLFAWKVVKHVKSNAIVFAEGDRTLAIGGGQTSRVESVKTAVMKAQFPLRGASVGSDAFFPFADGVEEIIRAGATAIIQPGGSVRDAEVIAAADACRRRHGRIRDAPLPALAASRPPPGGRARAPQAWYIGPECASWSWDPAAASTPSRGRSRGARSSRRSSARRGTRAPPATPRT